MNEKWRFLDGFSLKIIALVLMAVDHVGVWLEVMSGVAGQVGTIMRFVGRIAMPLFAFMMSEALAHTRNRWNYVLRLLSVWGIVFFAQTINYFLIRGGSSLYFVETPQAFTDLLMWALFIVLLESENKKLRPLAALPVLYVAACYVAGLLSESLHIGGYNQWSTYFPLHLRADYSILGFAIFLSFYYARKLSSFMGLKLVEVQKGSLEEFMETDRYRSLANSTSISLYIIVVILFWGLSKIVPAYDVWGMGRQTYCLLAAVFIFFYSGKRGYTSKWWKVVEYLFYPVHLVLIGLIFGLL